MASGVQIHDDCKRIFGKDLKLGKMYRYMLMHFTKGMKEICVEKLAPRDATYEDFLTEMSEVEAKGEGRFAVYDMDYESEQGSAKSKLVFFSWAPDSCKVKYKMVHASSKDALKKALGDGLGKEIQANDMSDMDWDCVLKEVRTHDRH